ncbi:MAG: ComEC/Rec2 family competence protein [Candidatus Peribacteraceae bacterium]|nr:ComEC/Rec2 family competence protein [Candidatus Peribacteraceae bacterium]
MRPSHISYAFLGSFLLTIFCLRWWQRTSYAPLTWILFAILALFVILAFLSNTRKPLLALAGILGLLLAMLSVARTTHIPDAMSIDAFANGTYVHVRGVIAAEPDRRPMKTKYTVETLELLNASGAAIAQVKGKILATDNGQWPEYRYGDTVLVSGKLEKPEAIETFQYDRYLSRYGIYAVMYRAGIRSEYEGRSGRRSLFAMKETFEAQINRIYPEPHASFMAGLLTGSRRGIPERLMEQFNVTGLTHIIAISGYNITIVISIIAGALFWLPLKWRFVPAIMAIALFTLFVGASAAVVRASIMGILGLLALQAGRQYDVRLAILWTLFFMLAWNPKYLWYDAGFQLSFLAVLGLTECAPLLERWFARVPQVLGMRESLQMTCAAQLAAVPLIIFLFGRLSLIAPIANVLVAPFIPLAMLFGFAGTLVSFIAFFPGQLIAYLGWGCLEWIVRVSGALARLPFASVSTPSINVFLIAGYYCVLAAMLVRQRRRSMGISVPTTHTHTPSEPAACKALRSL